MVTWKEFKTEVDKQLKEQEVSEDTEVSYIDLVCEGHAGLLFALSLDDDGKIVLS